MTDQQTLLQALSTLERARTFIRNGVALGYIRMPDADVPDTAHETLPQIEAAILALRASVETAAGSVPEAAKPRQSLAKLEEGAGLWKAFTYAVATRGATLKMHSEGGRTFTPNSYWQCTVGRSTVERKTAEWALHAALRLDFDGDVPASFGMPDTILQLVKMPERELKGEAE